MPDCTTPGDSIQVHHIKEWAKYISLRFEEKNGITLCFTCHKKIHGRELYYQRLFTRIVEAKYE